MGSGLMALLRGGGEVEKDAPFTFLLTIDLLRWKTRVDIN